MAWNSTDYDRVSAYLGYPPADYLGKVTTKMNDLESLSSTSVARVQGYLSELAAIEGQIVTARNVPGSAFSQLKGEARRFTKLISLALNLEVHEDVW